MAGCAEYSNFVNHLTQLMSSRLEFESVFRKLMGLPESSLDSISTKWKLLSHRPSEGSSFPLDQVYMMIGKEKQQQVIETLKVKPAAVQQLPAFAFVEHYQVKEVSFEAHLEGMLPVPRYLPLHLDVGASVPPEQETPAEQAQDYFMRFMMVQQCIDVTIAFSQDHKMAASNLLGLYKSPAMEANGN